MESYTALLSAGLSEMQLALDDAQLGQLQRYIGEIELFNPIYKLVGAHGEDLVIDHIFDSLIALPVIRECIASTAEPAIADLGSGAGLPGIPLAIALVEARFALVERMQRRVNFLRSAIVAAGLLERVRIIDTDLTAVQETFDLITFRAFHPLVDILDDVAPLVADGGWVCAYKGQQSAVEAELSAVEQRLESRWKSTLVPVSVPFLARARTLCLMQKL
ncbi:MAG TPA: 16S rRNA (guanine(527)-N(7))-methyltransferase RsmG [Sphaerochaeta sp.]|nr:16S rRNA (guanine(527)-N(7))-methyltransferase RsmG [Sphaerochaeta sp.]